MIADPGPQFADDGILPDPPAGAEAALHDREYRVRAFRLGPDRLAIQGAIRDQKPPGLFIQSDPEPLTVHHMQLSMEISFPDLIIVGAQTHFEQHPNEECPSITAHYEEMVGLSIARGFSRRVRELFGGPRGCTHTTALLQAMAPVALQCFWSMRSAAAKAAGEPEPMLRRDSDNNAETKPTDPLDDSWRLIVNTCHVWDEDGPVVAAIESGAPRPVPVFLRPRLEKLGIDFDDIGSGA